MVESARRCLVFVPLLACSSLALAQAPVAVAPFGPVSVEGTGLAELRRKRDATKAKRALDEIHDACKGQDNLLERFVAAAHADCTLGEIANMLRAEFGHYKEPKIL